MVLQVKVKSVWSLFYSRNGLWDKDVAASSLCGSLLQKFWPGPGRISQRRKESPDICGSEQAATARFNRQPQDCGVCFRVIPPQEQGRRRIFFQVPASFVWSPHCKIAKSSCSDSIWKQLRENTLAESMLTQREQQKWQVWGYKWRNPQLRR